VREAKFSLTYRVAISNNWLIAVDNGRATFKFKDYRTEGADRYKIMTLDAAEFIRRFLVPVLPRGFHRIRHYGLFANGSRAESLARVRELLAVSAHRAETDTAAQDNAQEPDVLALPRPCCGGRMIIIETFEPGCQPRYRPSASRVPIRIDTS
jgi:hypothetical protein